MDANSLQTGLAGLPIPSIQYFNEIGSTQEVALHWAVSGAEEGSLVIADEQTAGRGRFNRKWLTPRGSALAFSLILHPTALESPRMVFFSPLAGMAVSQVLLDSGCADVRIKWPNDVLLGDKKVSGILSEGIWVGSQVVSVVLGIGINVATSSVPGDGELLFPATSLEQSTGKKADRIVLLRSVLEEIHRLRSQLVTPEFISAWEDKLAFRGMPVQVEQIGKENITGILRGINMDGSLRIIRYTGEQVDITAGDLSLRPMNK